MSQNYTPVSWQDETTSQQGTLINAERLNQMQTAHHYADGFEEVDTVPTANPGVDYHKVVFCTADTTFYRWTGTEWVKDVDDTTAQELHEFEAQTATNLAGKVDKITGSSSETRIYSHKGATQGDVLAIADAVANSVAVRDPTAAIQAEYNENGSNTKDLVNRAALNNATTSIWQGINTKADKATTLAGYNIGDAYTKAQTDTALADKVGIIPVTTGVKFYAQSSGGTSLYQGTANAQTGITSVPMRDSNGRIKTAAPSADDDAAPKKYVDDGLSAKADKATTLAGYGITDAYTKTETDTLLTNGSVTKVGTSDVGTDLKPVKLVAGVPTAVTNNLVDTATAQTIGGTKTFTAAMTLNNDLNISMTRPTITGICGYALNTRGSSDSSATFMDMDRLYDSNNQYIRENTVKNYATFRDYTIGLHDKYENTTKDGAINLRVSAKDNYAYMTAPTRGYNAGSAYSNDIATIGTLDAYTPMVRISNPQTIAGIKTFTDPIIRSGGKDSSYIQIKDALFDNATAANFETILKVTDTSDNIIMNFGIRQNSNGTHILRVMLRNSDGSTYTTQDLVTST